MPWVFRGLRNGVLTTGYPARADAYADSWCGTVEARPATAAPAPGEADALRACCPTGAIEASAGQVVVDQGRCIGCGRCLREHPDRFSRRAGSDLARLTRQELLARADGGSGSRPAVAESGAAVPEPGPAVAEPGAADEESIAAVRADLAARVRALRRSVHLRHVDTGSDGSEEWEIAALLNPVYDIHRLGLFFTASPRHADVLLVTGGGVAGMREPLRRTLEAMPNPTVIVAVGTDACSGGLHRGSYSGADGVGGQLDVDVWVPGAPPSPFAILHGLLLGLGRLSPAGSGRAQEVSR